jgi:hypothetical protein
VFSIINKSKKNKEPGREIKNSALLEMINRICYTHGVSKEYAELVARRTLNVDQDRKGSSN